MPRATRCFNPHSVARCKLNGVTTPGNPAPSLEYSVFAGSPLRATSQAWRARTSARRQQSCLYKVKGFDLPDEPIPPSTRPFPT